ncbi:MAG: carbamoyltransferase HypF, partial [Desulfobacterales bacterium]|nr:carbamoyltransferase HypF [Desulfobacterales bacterium]
MSPLVSAQTFDIKGIVQGVGFRPYIYQLASGHDLKGSVINTAFGVRVHVEGRPENVEDFRRAVAAKAPPMARIHEIVEQKSQPRGFSDFTIGTTNRGQSNSRTLICPDTAVCEDCRAEMRDPEDRRYKYPFINCTNCGPRYTIVHDLPYDRPYTTMKHFEMCDQCRAEYHDPSSRRFHAQPNACPVCGPRAAVCDSTGEKIPCADPIAHAADQLKTGAIVAIKGLGGFHLAADAANPDAVARLRRKKGRAEKPFAVMAPNLEQVRAFARISPEEQDLLTSCQRPIVLVEKKQPHCICEAVAPDNPYFGVMLTYTPLHDLLLDHGFAALVMTSGNKAGEPIVMDNESAFLSLGRLADCFLIHDRDICVRADDSIVRHVAGRQRVIRRSRGYAPAPLALDRRCPQILACGAELKNTVCLTKDENAFLSQHIGDLENPEAFDFFQSTMDHLRHILDITPEVVAHDMHPDYMSTRYALAQPAVRHVAVQHHHAHVVSCMAENRISGTVIGLAFDGTGYGTDGRIWGGEVLAADQESFVRAAHLQYVPMPGGNAAVADPRRMAAGWLHQTFGNQWVNLDLECVRSRDPEELAVLSRMIEKQVNSPLTSGMGRLFDTVAAISGVHSGLVEFEGQAAMKLEAAAGRHPELLEPKAAYPYALLADTNGAIELRPLIRAVVDDVQAGRTAAEISRRFHSTLVYLFSQICDQIRGSQGLNRVVLTGGVFQNAYLLGIMSAKLEAMGFSVYTHRLVPANDGGISLGQAVC